MNSRFIVNDKEKEIHNLVNQSARPFWLTNALINRVKMQQPLSELIDLYYSKVNRTSINQENVTIVILDSIRMWLSLVNDDSNSSETYSSNRVVSLFGSKNQSNPNNMTEDFTENYRKIYGILQNLIKENSDRAHVTDLSQVFGQNSQQAPSAKIESMQKDIKELFIKRMNDRKLQIPRELDQSPFIVKKQVEIDLTLPKLSESNSLIFSTVIQDKVLPPQPSQEQQIKTAFGQRPSRFSARTSSYGPPDQRMKSRDESRSDANLLLPKNKSESTTSPLLPAGKDSLKNFNSFGTDEKPFYK